MDLNQWCSSFVGNSILTCILFCIQSNNTSVQLFYINRNETKTPKVQNFTPNVSFRKLNKLYFVDKLAQGSLNDWFNANRRDILTTMITQTKHHWESLMLDLANKIFSKTPFNQILIQD